MNTSKSVSKQRTLNYFRMNTFEKPGEGVPAMVNQFSDMYIRSEESAMADDDRPSHSVRKEPSPAKVIILHGSQFLQQRLSLAEPRSLAPLHIARQSPLLGLQLLSPLARLLAPVRRLQKTPIVLKVLPNPGNPRHPPGNPIPPLPVSPFPLPPPHPSPPPHTTPIPDPAL